jgi:hypothetical protein
MLCMAVKHLLGKLCDCTWLTADCTLAARVPACLCVYFCARAQLLSITYRTPAKRLVTLGWCIAPGERSEGYAALLELAMGMAGETGMGEDRQRWCLRDALNAPGMVVITDWAKAITSAVRRMLPNAVPL